MKFAIENGRIIPKTDKIFELNNRAKAMIAERGKTTVINGTIGALLDDNGDLAILSSVMDELKKLDDKDFAEYTSISGIEEFKKAIVKAALGKVQTSLKTEVVATPGGTGAIKNAIANYTSLGDSVLTSDWYWSPYNSLCQEQLRRLETYQLFDDVGNFNFDSFEKKVKEILENQENLLILLNTPAHNPTGYSLCVDEWKKLINILNADLYRDKKIILFIDVAYIDFAGADDEVRAFITMLEKLNENVLSILAYSASKTFTLYGMRTGAMICLNQDEGVLNEFKRFCEFSSRNSWSNCNRSGQKLIANLYENKEALDRVDEERKIFRDMLLERGKCFEKEALARDLRVVPFVSGFFICVECENSEDVSEKLAKDGIFVVPLAKGVRISVASINKEQCKVVVEKLAEILK